MYSVDDVISDFHPLTIKLFISCDERKKLNLYFKQRALVDLTLKNPRTIRSLFGFFPNSFRIIFFELDALSSHERDERESF
jgi:hypothetical protein